MIKEVQLFISVNSSKSVGHDNIHARFIKEIACELALPVYILFNKSLSEGDLPQIWEMAYVSCIFKSGDRTRACNYRPISLTSLFCRLLEKVVRTAMMSFCSDNLILSNSQFGFRDRRGCILQYLTLLALDRGFAVDATYLDLQKAFDTVPYNRLLLKLESIGISGNILKWIKRFLSDRKRRVLINGISSEWTCVTSGVLQGSVLGTLLFILYINDLPEIAKSHCKLFADDAKIYKEINDVEDFEDLQVDLFKLCRWTTKWLLFFNQKM